MLQPRTYPELIGKALVLEAEPFITMLEDDNPWAEGLFLTVCVGVAIGVAQLIGGLLLTASLPSADAVFAVLLHGWRELGIAPESDATRIEDTLRRIWELMTTLIGYSGGWERLFVMIIAPFNLVFQWLFVGLICYVAGRGTGGTGTLNQTLGATSLMAAPNVLYMLQIIPLVSVSGILIFFWTALIVYRAVEVVHDLSWRHSAFVTLAPLMVLLGFSMVGIVVLTMMIAGEWLMNIYPFVEQATGIGPMGPSWLRDWFPTLQQMSNAVQLRFDSSVQPINTSDKNELNSGEPADVRPMNISMRQGIGLICASALIAGMLTFLVHWIGGIWSSTYYPISTFTQFVENQNIAESETDSYRAILAQTTRGIGSLRPLWPVWLASGLTALGHWINWPLRWLTVWIVYGFGVLLTSLVLGATTTLQRFYAVTSYASVPLTATILLPIPCIGALAVVASGFWALAIYVMAVHAVTELDFVRTAIAIVAPGAVVLLSLIFALTTVSVFALRLVL